MFVSSLLELASNFDARIKPWDPPISGKSKAQKYAIEGSLAAHEWWTCITARRSRSRTSRVSLVFRLQDVVCWSQDVVCSYNGGDRIAESKMARAKEVCVPALC